jgi:integration host factor subunit alpha
MTITKASLAQVINDEVGLNQRHAAELVDLFFAEIKNTLEQAEVVKLSGFGNFILRDKTSRPGRNPKTGEAAMVSARRIVAFKPGQKFKKQIECSDQLQ